ncbi:MAG: heme-binding protein [Isosphaeraceae bacterium]
MRLVPKGLPRSSVRFSALILAIAIVPMGAFGPVARAQEAGTRTSQRLSEIRDKAGLFAADAIASASRELERVEQATGAAIVIETIDTLKGDPADKVAVKLAERSGIHGLFILISRKERKLEVLASRQYREVLTDSRRNAIREAFFEGFRKQDFSEGLRLGVAAIGKALATVHRAEPAPRSTVTEALTWSGATTGSRSDSPLVVRNQVRLTLLGARAILAGSAAKAQAMGVKENIAVVDEGGHLIAFERMDGARPASIYTAMTKAATAATVRQPTGPLPPGSTSPDPLLNLSLENAAIASGGKFTTLHGGVPILVDGQVIGGVGVGGATGEQDAQVARAGIQAFIDQLATPQTQPAAGPSSPNPSNPPKPTQTEGAAAKRPDGDF